MRIFINRKEITIFAGARVLDAVRAYSVRSAKRLLNGSLSVFDRFGNPTEPDGRLTDGQILSIRKTK
ncbi:MAG TPA: hypothetical protein PLJ84_11340 [Bacteroidales bacterium]|nr:hypothetical protein [Bacteroidales bacterium]HPT03182.1 hypothetical protein [Bacteroidales bacterium]